MTDAPAATPPTDPVDRTLARCGLSPADERIARHWIDARARTPRTAINYAATLKFFRDRCPKALAEVTYEDLVRFAADLRRARVPENSQATRVAIIRSLFKFAFKVGHVPANIAEEIPIPRIRDKRNERKIEEEQALEIIARESNDRNRVICQMFYGLGLRIDELHTRDRKHLRPKPNPKKNGAVLDILGKGGKQRSVLVPPELYEAIVAVLPARGSPTDPLFVSREGSRLSTTQIWRIVKKAARRVGLDPVSPHWLRHAHASHAIDKGAPLPLVRDQLGHANIATTSLYLHGNPRHGSASYISSVAFRKARKSGE